MPKPSSASSTVIQTWSQSGPSGVPTVAQVQILWPICEGRPKKNGSIVFVRERISQLPSITTANSTRRVRTSARWRRAFALAAATPSSRAACTSTSDIRGSLRALVADEDLVAQVLPDVAVELDEPGLEPDLGHVTGTRQVDRVDPLDRAGTRRHHADAVGQRDRLLEIVRHEHDRRGRRRPQIEQLVLHQRARLHVEGAE